MSPLSVRIRELRERAKLTQAELAVRAGVSPSTVYNLEAGRRRMVNLDVLAKVAAVLDVRPGDLLGESDTPKRRRPR